MLGLLKSDLYRIFNPRRLHGEFYGCAIALLVLITGALGFTSFMIHQATTNTGLIAAGDVAELAGELNVALGSPSAFLGSILLDGGMLGIVTMLGVALITCADLRDGFAKTLMQGGARAVYYREKIVFYGIWAGLALIVGTIIALALSTVFGFHLSLDEDPLHFLAWLGLTWLGLWTLSLIALASACLLRGMGAIYFVIIFVGAGAVSGAFSLLAEICEMFSQFNLGATSMHTAVRAFAQLLPTNLIGQLAQGAQAAFEPATALGSPLPGGFASQALLGFCLVAAASIAIILTKGPKREF